MKRAWSRNLEEAAAGLEEQLPTDLRPPDVLKRTCDYLFDEVIGNAPSLGRVHLFVWDRTRAIRNDFSIQQVTKPDELRLAIDCYERIARFHILSLHQLALPEKPYSKYDWQQEREQLDRTLLSLMQYYDDSRNRIDMPNEAEFRAYCVIFQLQDPTPDLDDRVQTWPKAIVKDFRVQKAVDLYMAACNVMDAQGPLKPRANHLIARQDWQRFWTLVSSNQVSYLMACVAEIYFNLIRRMVLSALFRTFRMNSTLATPDWTVETLCELLAFDDGEELYTYCERFGFSFKEREDGLYYLDLTSVSGKTLPEPSAGMPKQSKSNVVEQKRLGRTLPAVINGLAVKQARDIGLVTEEENIDEKMKDNMSGPKSDSGCLDGAMNVDDESVDDGESLFIPANTTIGKTQGKNPFAFDKVPTSQSASTFRGGAFSASPFGKVPDYTGEPNAFAQPHNLAYEEIGSSSSIQLGVDFTKPAPSLPSANAASKPLFNFSGRAVDNNTEQSDQKGEESSVGQDTPIQDIFQAKMKSDSSGEHFALGQASDQTSTVTEKSATLAQTPPNFSFTSPTNLQNSSIDEIGNADVAAPAQFTTTAIESHSPSPERSKSLFTFGQPSGAAASPSPSAVSLQPETNSLQSQVTSPSTSLPSAFNNHSSSDSNSGQGLKRPSFSTDTKPKKPSPLHNSITAGEEGSTATKDQSESYTENGQDTTFVKTPHTSQSQLHDQVITAEESDALITRLTEDLCHDPDLGFFKQYIEFAVHKTIREVYDEFVMERHKKEADERRQFALHQKYGRRWREIFRQNRLAKTGRERRQRRQRRLQQRQSEQPDSSSLNDGTSFGGGSRGGFVFNSRSDDLHDTADNGDKSRQSLKGRTGSWRSANETHVKADNKRRTPSQGEDAAAASRPSGHKRLKSTSHLDGRGRITKPTPTSHPSADLVRRSPLLGSSVINGDSGHNKNTTMSNYFRHKAMGLDKVDELSGLRGTKRRSESPQVSSPTSPPAFRPTSRLEQTANRALMPPPSLTPSRSMKANDDDEALFARLRAARDSLKDSSSLSRPEAGKDNRMSASVSSQSSTDSPSMLDARAKVRLRAAEIASRSGASSVERSVPAYRLRESRFVPREHYGRAIERAQEIRNSRSRETSRPQSRADYPPAEQTSPDSNARLMQEGGKKGSSIGNESTSRPFTAPRLNGLSRDGLEANKLPAHPAQRETFESQFRVPVNFADHTTQLSSDNPFLKNTAPDSVDKLVPQLAFNPLSAHLQDDYSPQEASSFKAAHLSIDEAQNHTIRPSQIDESLMSSFGTSGSGLNRTPANLYTNPTPLQKDSYMHSESISLISDDGRGDDADDDASVDFEDTPMFLGHAETDQASEQLLEDDGDYGGKPELYPRPVRTNQFFDAGLESQGWNCQEEAVRSRSAEIHEEDSERGVNGYADDEDEGEHAVDVDVDEDDDETDDEDEEDEGGSEYEEEDDEEEEESDEQGQPQQYGSLWTGGPAKTLPAWQEVGNTPDEAIELSD